MERLTRSQMMTALFLAAAGGARAACPCAYVPNGGDNKLKVIDLTSNSVTATVTLAGFPFAAAVNPAGTRVYVVEQAGNALAVVNAATNAVITTLPGFSTPWSIAVDPAGARAYVSNTGLSGTGSGTVTVVDLSTNAILGTLAVGDTPHGLAFTPDGSRLFVANSLAGTVSVINVPAYTAETPLSTGLINPEGVAVNLAGTRLYVSDPGSSQVQVYSLPALTHLAAIPVATGPAELAVDPLGARLHVVAGAIPGKLPIIDAGANSVLTTLTVGDGPAGVAFKPDGSRAYVPNSGSLSNSVSVINATNNTIATTITGLNAPQARGRFIVSPPWIASLSPAQAQAGGAGFALTVYGTGFIATSQVLWNGAARATTVVNDRQLTALIPAGDLAVPGNATVTVNNPAPAGGVSPTGLTFTVCSGPPSPGNGLTAGKASPNVHLAWTPVSGATSYNVRACTAPFSGGCVFATIGAPTTPAWDDPVLGTTASYRYAIEAVNACGPTP